MGVLISFLQCGFVRTNERRTLCYLFPFRHNIPQFLGFCPSFTVHVGTALSGMCLLQEIASLWKVQRYQQSGGRGVFPVYLKGHTKEVKKKLCLLTRQVANLACGSKLSERRLQTTSQVPLPPSKVPSDWGSLLERPCWYQSLHSRWRQLLQSGVSKGLDLRQNVWGLFCFGLVCFLVVFLWRERKGEETNTFSKTTPGMFKQLFIYLTCILWLLCFS